MVNKVVNKDTAPVTHSVFSDQIEEEELVGEEEDPDAPPKPKNTDILTTFKHVFIP